MSAPNDVLDFMREDHQAVLRNLARLRDETDLPQRIELRCRFESALTLHLHVEQQLLFEAARSAADPGLREAMDRACDDHGEIEEALTRLMRMPLGDPGWRQVVEELETQLLPHFEQEESSLFAALSQALAVEERVRLLYEASERKNELLMLHATSSLDPARSSTRLPSLGLVSTPTGIASA